MLFCGQCGFKLNTGDTQCPRCGAPIEPGAPLADDAQPDAPTVASPSLAGPMQPQIPVNSESTGEPQKLILPPNSDAGTSNYGIQDAYDATRRMELPEQRYGTPLETPLPGAVPFRSANAQTPYSSPGGNYPPSGMYDPRSRSNYVPQGTPYSRPLQQGYQPNPTQERRTSTNARGRTAALLIILLGLLLLLVAIILFILERNNVFGSTHSDTSSAVTYLAPESLYSMQPSLQRFVCKSIHI